MSTKADLVRIVASKTGMSQEDAERAINAVSESIQTIMHGTDRLNIPGFGSFTKKMKAETKAKNLRTGEDLIVPAHNVIGFRPATEWKNAVKGGPHERSLIESPPPANEGTVPAKKTAKRGGQGGRAAA